MSAFFAFLYPIKRGVAAGPGSDQELEGEYAFGEALLEVGKGFGGSRA